MSTSSTSDTVGVQQLIDRLKAEGVQEGQQQADALLAAAKKQAVAIIESARTEAEAIERTAQQQAQRTKTNGTRTLSLASRDTAIHLKEQLEHEFRGWIGRLVHEQLSTTDFLSELIRSMASQAMDSVSGQSTSADEATLSNLQILTNEANAASLDDFVKSQTASMLRQGVSVFPDRTVKHGFRLRIAGHEVEIDFSEEAVTAALMRFLAPKFRQLISSVPADAPADAVEG